MNLEGQRISSSAGASIRIQAGQLLCVFQDRRAPDGQNEARLGTHARRRKLPSRFLHLVGTGRLWVAKGWLRIDAAEAAAYPRSAEMVIRVSDLIMQIAHLKPRDEAGLQPGSQCWAFHALFLPGAKQLERLATLGLTDAAASSAESEPVDLDKLFDETSSFSQSSNRLVFKVR